MLNEKLGEEWYDAEIAPKLLELADRCRERGMAIVATVEYAPGERGSTMALPDGTGLAMQMLRICANAGENVDGYMIALRKFCDANGIDTGAIIFMRGPNYTHPQPQAEAVRVPAGCRAPMCNCGSRCALAAAPKPYPYAAKRDELRDEYSTGLDSPPP